MLRVPLQVGLNDFAGDMLARFNPKGRLVHGKVAVFVGPQHVIGFESHVEALLGPDTPNGRPSVQKDDVACGIDLEEGFGSREAVPSC